MKKSTVATLLLGASGAAFAQAGNTVVYRCPGPPPLYTDAITPQQAKDRNCRTIEGAPVTVVQMPKPRTPAAPVPAASRPADAKVDPAAQRERDSDARAILEAELRREEDRLAELKREYNNGEPERQGNERNYQRYLDRVAELKAAVARKEGDIAAIKREIAKLPG
jgi:hypothetical protein